MLVSLKNWSGKHQHHPKTIPKQSPFGKKRTVSKLNLLNSSLKTTRFNHVHKQQQLFILPVQYTYHQFLVRFSLLRVKGLEEKLAPENHEAAFHIVKRCFEICCLLVGYFRISLWCCCFRVWRQCISHIKNDRIQITDMNHKDS